MQSDECRITVDFARQNLQNKTRECEGYGLADFPLNVLKTFEGF